MDSSANLSNTLHFFLGKEEWMPLYLSFIAGASTCLGAAVVFLHPKHNNSGERSVSPQTMSFSLALAGSVMVTVSLISIGPECLQDPAASAAAQGTFRLLPLWSVAFLQRLVSFGVGCVLYWGLSKFAFPQQPEEVVVWGMEQSLLPPTTISSGSTSITCLEEDSDTTKQDDDDVSEGPVQVDELSLISARDENTHRQLWQGSKQVSRRCRGIVAATAEMNSTTNHSYARNDVWIHTASTFDSALSDDVEQPLVSMQENHYCKEDDCSGKDRKATNSTLGSWSRWSSGADLAKDQRRAWRVAMLLFVSLLCHNFPEGLAVAASSLESENLGIAVTIGILIHNIPEGIAIAIPCLAARPDRPWLSFALASASGLAEPLGAFLALIFLRNVDRGGVSSSDANLLNMENVLAFVAGIMITVALYELFPEANRHTSEQGKGPIVAGTLAGILVMVATEYNLP